MMRTRIYFLLLVSFILLVLAITLRSDSRHNKTLSLNSSLAYSSPHKFVNKSEENIAAYLARSLAEGKRANRLIKEKSPYLLQHAFNPVDWYPWGEEPFAKARREQKPIFLSIGYSTCYWCHVMEREVFENEDIAALMNKYLVNIKVDREERPDIDRVYMTALQAMTGGGGWPMSLFLTPDLKPFFAGTYFPPDNKDGRPGFKFILERINALWTKERGKLIQSGDQIIRFLQERTAQKPQEIPLENSILEKGLKQSKALFDKEHGGFGKAPKFPWPVKLNFLLHYYQRTSNEDALNMIQHTLTQMAKGGIHDHIGGGFHRYSTDRQWRVPHFEKMLYDQAQLARTYLETYRITQEQLFADTARDILDYVLRIMTSPEGGFFSAEDAESAIDPTKPEEKEEGAFYVWPIGEIERVLGKEDAKIFNFYYGVKEEGNVYFDPYKEFVGENILYLAHTLEETAKEFKQPATVIKSLLEQSRKKLFTRREKRLRPHLDDKILTSWNAMMISAFARGYQILEDKRYLAAAQKGADFILAKLYTRETGRLLHRYRDGEARYDAHLEDYAFFTMGLLDLYAASKQGRWLDYAIVFTKAQEQLFWDANEGGFFDTAGKDKNILLRTKEDYDGAEPTGNSIAALNLLQLFQRTDNERWQNMAEKTLKLFSGRLQQYPQAMPQMLVALDYYIQSKNPAAAPRSLQSSADKVKVSTQLSVNKVHPGAEFQVAVVLDIKGKWHINSHIPTYEFLIGTRLDLEVAEGVRVQDIRYPKTERFKFSFAEDILDVYAGRVPILINLNLTENFPQGHHFLKGILHVQACNDQACLSPSAINIEIPFEVVGFDQPISLNKSGLFPHIRGSYPPALSPPVDNEIAQMFKKKGTLFALLGIFIIGLALNLTPCVYPMLAITVSLFGSQSHKKAGTAFLKALVYVLGIATMYTALGVIAAFTGGMFGGMLQNTWVLAGIAVLFLALALSMFGLYELQPPYWLTKRIGGAQSVGIIGIYLSGLVVGIFAAPCIGPPIIALLTLVGTRGDVPFAFWSFFTLSLGLGAPYLVLGTFSGVLNKLPQSGIWLVWVKKILGFMLMGLTLYYLALAVKPNLVPMVIPATLIGGGLYILAMERPMQGGKIFMMQWKWVAGLIAIMIGTGAIFINQKEGTEWELYHPRRLEAANRNGQPVILDFYADWCIPCLKMDRSTFSDPKVIAALKDFMKLKVDLTHPDFPEGEALVRQYHVLGVPTIIFLDSQGSEITAARIVGYLSPREFLNKIEMLKAM